MKSILRFNPDRSGATISQSDLLGMMFDTIFTGGIPKGDEGSRDSFEEVKKLISQPDITYESYLKKISFNYSMDSLAYQSPWYTYDKRFNLPRSYRDFVWEIKKVYGIKIAYFFFTEKFTKVIKSTPKNLKGIENVFFDPGYKRFT